MAKKSVWQLIRAETTNLIKQEPLLAGFFQATVLQYDHFTDALGYILSNKLSSELIPAISLRETIMAAYQTDKSLVEIAERDLLAIKARDPAIIFYSAPLLYLKGYHALQAYRVAHWLWLQDKKASAIYLQNQISLVFGVDIHPAAIIGYGIMLDHATGIVIGETAIVEDDVSILQSVTLGGTGKECGDRHPKICSGVMIGAGAKILGNIEVGKGAKIGAGSVVLEPVPPHTTVAGVPARIVGKPKSTMPSLDMDQDFEI